WNGMARGWDLTAHFGPAGSETPGGGKAGVGDVRAERAGPHRAGEVVPECRALLADPCDGGLDRLRDVHSGSLRVGGSPSVPPSQADRGRELAGEEVRLFPCSSCALEVSPTLGFLLVVPELLQSTAVRRLGSSVESRLGLPVGH